ncbi:hypothetical protein [Amycolatopsis sp. cmx-4-68]|uniref:hypothetical protein n=1 Tax=Amycolatopsis sp. cmx-4-68 TaxID=2790938 RepID=UPI00397C5D92
MPDQPFTLADIHAAAHAWGRKAPTLGALDDWLFRCEVDDARQEVEGWLTYTDDGKVKELREDIPYSLILDFANKFGSPLVVLDRWMVAMCEKAGVTVPLFPDRPHRTFS